MRRRYFLASLNKGRKSACSFVTSPMTGYKDKKHFLIGQVSKDQFGAKRFVVRLGAAVSLGGSVA